jgi:ubiquitin thioesterase protein OTUB1
MDNASKDGGEASLMESFCSSSHSDYFVAYLRWDISLIDLYFKYYFNRLFTSAYLQMNSDFFENFIEDGKTVKQFCSSVC